MFIFDDINYPVEDDIVEAKGASEKGCGCLAVVGLVIVCVLYSLAVIFNLI
jgi:hypothetical protein